MKSEKEIRAWYNKKYLSSGRDTWRPVQAYPIILEYLDIEAGEKLLDIGCGTGHLNKLAAQKNMGSYGVDISEEAIKIARSNAPDATFVATKGEGLPFSDNFFEYVVCLGALEHFRDIEQGIKEMMRVSKQDALLCLMVPNIDYLFWKFKKEKGTEQKEINETLLSLRKWSNLFESQGLEIIDVHQDEWPIKRIKIFSTSNPFTIIKKTLHKLVWRFIPFRYTYQFIFVLKCC